MAKKAIDPITGLRKSRISVKAGNNLMDLAATNPPEVLPQGGE